MGEPSVDRLLASFSQWYTAPTSRAISFEHAMGVASDQIVAAGFSLEIMRIVMLTQHPEVSGLAYEWRKGEGVRVTPLPHDRARLGALGSGPMDRAQQTGQRVNIDLRDPNEAARPEVAEFVALGATDLIAEPLPLSDGRVNCVLMLTRRPEGFTAADRELAARLAPIVATRVELRSLRHALDSLLSTYLGPNAAARVISGSFRRGTGESTRAAIWFCDMRGFTALSDCLPAREVVATLDAFFEPIVAAVEDHGGEILKFIGDAALAVFPVVDGDDAAACRRALETTDAAARGIDALNDTRGEAGLPPVAMGVAMHIGEVMYGNIGGRQRLDFTVIGAAVNEASRLESMCKTLGVSVVVSGAVARALPDVAFASLGVHAVRGVSAPQELFTLPR